MAAAVLDLAGAAGGAAACDRAAVCALTVLLPRLARVCRPWPALRPCRRGLGLISDAATFLSTTLPCVDRAAAPSCTWGLFAAADAGGWGFSQMQQSNSMKMTVIGFIHAAHYFRCEISIDNGSPDGSPSGSPVGDILGGVMEGAAAVVVRTSSSSSTSSSVRTLRQPAATRDVCDRRGLTAASHVLMPRWEHESACLGG